MCAFLLCVRVCASAPVCVCVCVCVCVHAGVLEGQVPSNWVAGARHEGRVSEIVEVVGARVGPWGRKSVHPTTLGTVCGAAEEG